MTHYIRLNNKEEMQKLLDEGLLLTNHGFMVEDEHPFNNFPAIFEITNKDEEIKSEFIPIKTELETHYDLKYHIMVKESPKEYIYNDYVSWYKNAIGINDYMKLMNKQYYLQNTSSYVGNSPLWWGLNSSGYVTDIDKAQLYTEEEAFKLYNQRNSDLPWLKEDVEKAIKRTVDAQYLSRSNDSLHEKIKEIKFQEEKDEENRIQKIKDEEKRILGMGFFIFCEETQRELNEIFEALPLGKITNEKILKELSMLSYNDRIEFHEYYYPNVYFIEDERILEMFYLYDIIFKCNNCNKIDRYRDEEHNLLCEECSYDLFYDEI